MSPNDIIAALKPADYVALALLVIAWLGIGWHIDRAGVARPSVSVLMAEYRREWMRQYVHRSNRIFDAQIVTSLRQGASFFASTMLIASGGVLALAGNTAPLEGPAEEIIRQDEPTLLWQIKLLVVALFLTHAFLKFVWSHRIFGYCSVMMAAVPDDPGDLASAPRATRAGELNIRAAFNFNRGLRSMHFALASMGWLFGPYALIASTLVVTFILWSREFRSISSDILREHGTR